jgi:hypothetical protein
VAALFALQEPEWQPPRKKESQDHGHASENNLESSMVRAQELTQTAKEVTEGQKDDREAKDKTERAQHRTTP